MNDITPQQMRELANASSWTATEESEWNYQVRAALRTAADRLEAISTHEPGPRTPDGGSDGIEQSADSEPYDALSDPANARVVAALRESRPYFAPPAHEDKVIAMLRERGLWKPEYDHD